MSGGKFGSPREELYQQLNFWSTRLAAAEHRGDTKQAERCRQRIDEISDEIGELEADP
jgi:hypothetical protein